MRALNAFLADVYGDGCILSDGVVPRDLVLGCPQFRRAAVGIKPPLGNFVTVAGIDLVRGADGRFYVLEDNVRTPSGVSYVIENRVVMTRLVPTLMRASRVRSVERYPADLLQCLMEMSPSGKSNPTIALLTPGPYNSAFFEHVFLSQQMGIELVEGVDLVCVDRKLYMKDVHGLRQIDVLYRRIDDDFLDPLVFRPDSLLGVAGLTARSARRKRGDCQRCRHGSRRRQGGLCVHARDDSLLPGRGADSTDRRDLPAARS